MSSNAPPAGPKRRNMRLEVGVGTTWARKRDGSLWLVRQSWRTDRVALLQSHDDPDDRITVRFSDLSAKWRKVGGK